MSRVSTYLNFPRTTEEAFNFYKSVFKTEFVGEINRFGGVPTQEGQQPLAEEDKNLIMHMALPILGGHVLMGTDMTESMGFKINVGNNVSIMLEPDTRDETDKLYAALSKGGNPGSPVAEAFWGDYFGYCTDKFGINWMFNCSSKS